MKTFLCILGMFAFVFLFANISMANINVDSDTDCTNGTETGTFTTCGQDIIVWWSGGSNAPSGNYCFTLYSGNEQVGLDNASFDGECVKSSGTGTSGTFYPATIEIQVPCTNGSYRLKVNQGTCDGPNVGGDSFKVKVAN